MKKKIFAYLLIAFVFLFPFKYAVLAPTSSNTFNLICMIATVIGTLAFIGISNSEDEQAHQ